MRKVFQTSCLILWLVYFPVQSIFGESRSNMIEASKGGFTYVDSLSTGRDIQCSSGNENPSCNKAIGGLVIGGTPGAISKGLQLTGPFAKGRSDEPGQQVIGKIVKDDIGKGITVSYTKHNGSTVHSVTKYYKFNKKAGAKGDGDKSDSSEEGNIADISDNAANQESLEAPANILRDVNLPENDLFKDNNDLACANPDDPRCR